MKKDKQIKENNQSQPLVYETPVLISYGDVRDVTLGPTPGTLESGAETTRCERGIGVCF